MMMTMVMKIIIIIIIMNIPRTPLTGSSQVDVCHRRREPTLYEGRGELMIRENVNLVYAQITCPRTAGETSILNLYQNRFSIFERPCRGVRGFNISCSTHGRRNGCQNWNRRGYHDFKISIKFYLVL